MVSGMAAGVCFQRWADLEKQSLTLPWGGLSADLKVLLLYAKDSNSMSDFARHLETQPRAQLWPLAVQLGQGQRQGLEPEEVSVFKFKLSCLSWALINDSSGGCWVGTQ